MKFICIYIVTLKGLSIQSTKYVIVMCFKTTLVFDFKIEILLVFAE